MCFSATANFVGSGVLGAIGVVTLTEVKHRREVLFAAVPCLFALHQFTEGFVWLSLDHLLPATVAHDAGAVFILYAQGLLPFLLPLSVLLLEPTLRCRRRMLSFAILGGGLTLYTLWGLIAAPLQVYLRDQSIAYVNRFTDSAVVAVIYVVATCGALLFSGYRDLVVLGVLNIVGLIVVMLLKSYAFTSLWCAYAAAVSVIIYFFFRRSREARPGSYAAAAS
jgi:ABC-type multidrug transport system fused ATPase/permease subunit